MAGDELEDGLPDVVDCDGLHAGAVVAGLHFAEEEARLPGGMAPDGDVPGVIQGIRAVFLGTGGTEDGNDRNVDCRSQVHGAAVIADKERALFKLGRQFPKGGLARQVDNSVSLRSQSVLKLLIERHITRAANKEHLSAQFMDEFTSQFLVAVQRPAFGGQIHAWIAAAAGKQGYSEARGAADALSFLRRWFETHAGSSDGQAYCTCQIEIYFGLVLKMGRRTGDRYSICERETATKAIGTHPTGDAGQPGQKSQHGRAVENEGQVKVVHAQSTRKFPIVRKAVAAGDADGAAINHCINGWMVFWYDFRPCTRNIDDAGVRIGMADDLQ